MQSSGNQLILHSLWQFHFDGRRNEDECDKRGAEKKASEEERK